MRNFARDLCALCARRESESRIFCVTAGTVVFTSRQQAGTLSVPKTLFG
jgi:hypothetical protein